MRHLFEQKWLLMEIWLPGMSGRGDMLACHMQRKTVGFEEGDSMLSLILPVEACVDRNILLGVCDMTTSCRHLVSHARHNLYLAASVSVRASWFWFWFLFLCSCFFFFCVCSVIVAFFRPFEFTTCKL